MKKLIAATLLSVSLCASQTGGAWASTQTHFPPPVSSAGTDVGSQSWLTVEVLIAGILLLLLIEWDEKMRENDRKVEDITEVCDFYEENREGDEKMLGFLGDQLWDARSCSHLFDSDGYDIDKNGNRIWPKN